MGKTYRAVIDDELYGAAEKGDEYFHEIYFYGGEKYTIELEAEDEDVDLDLYITDDEDNIIYKDEEVDSGAAVEFEPGEDAVYRIYIKAVDGDTDYTITIKED